MSLVTITLIRHAQSEANVSQEDRLGGRYNMQSPLTEFGKNQAVALGNYFKKECKTFTAAYSSTALRTKQTAEHCFKAMNCDLSINTSKKLLEQDAGIWEGTSRVIYERADVRLALDTDNWNYVLGDGSGESQAMVAERMKKWIEKKVIQYSAKNDNQHLIIFTHGLAIKYLLAELLDLNRSTAYSENINPCDNASITELQYRNGQLILPITVRNQNIPIIINNL